MTQSVTIAELAGVLHTLEASGDETWTTCGDALDPRDIPQFRAPSGAAWDPEKHSKPCPECFPRLNGATPMPAPKVDLVKDESFVCPRCERTFSTEHGRAVHVARSHKADKPAEKQPTKMPATTSKYNGIAAAKLKKGTDTPLHSLSCSEDGCEYIAASPSQMAGHKSGHARRANAQVVTSPPESPRLDDGDDDPHGSAPATSSHDESDDSGGRGSDASEGKSSVAWTLQEFLERARQRNRQGAPRYVVDAPAPNRDTVALLAALEAEYGKEVYGFARGFLVAREVPL